MLLLKFWAPKTFSLIVIVLSIKKIKTVILLFLCYQRLEFWLMMDNFQPKVEIDKIAAKTWHLKKEQEIVRRRDPEKRKRFCWNQFRQPPFWCKLHFWLPRPWFVLVSGHRYWCHILDVFFYMYITLRKQLCTACFQNRPYGSFDYMNRKMPVNCLYINQLMLDSSTINNMRILYLKMVR